MPIYSLHFGARISDSHALFCPNSPLDISVNIDPNENISYEHQVDARTIVRNSKEALTGYILAFVDREAGRVQRLRGLKWHPDTYRAEPIFGQKAGLIGVGQRSCRTKV